MAGTIHGRLEMYSNLGSNYNNMQEQFVNIHSFINSWHPGSRIALQYGKAGTGTNFWNLANPFTTNAFTVFRFTTTAGWNFYLLVQGTWSASEAFGNSPGNPGYANGGNPVNAIGIAAAVALTSGGADSNPWVNAGGGTGNAGADVKGSPVWAAPSGGKLFVLPRSNNLPRGYHADGTVSTLKQNCAMAGRDGNGIRYHMFMDDDAFVLFTTTSTTYTLTYVGTYTPAPDFSAIRPLVMFSVATTPTEWFGQNMGGYTGALTWEGGIVTGNPAFPVGPVVIDRYNASWGSSKPAWNPNPQFATATNMEWALPLVGYVSGGEFPAVGYIGRINSPLLRYVYNWTTHNLNSSPFWTRICLGWSTTQATTHWTAPWDGVTPPGNGTTRVGLNDY